MALLEAAIACGIPGAAEAAVRTRGLASRGGEDGLSAAVTPMAVVVPPGTGTMPARDPIFPLPQPGGIAYVPAQTVAPPSGEPAQASVTISPTPAAFGEPAANPMRPAASGPVVGAGQASWYGPGFHGRRTASGETFNQNAFTAAHRTLPFGSRVQVVNQRTGASIVVRINDRGPHMRGRIIDLSRASAQALGIGGAGPVRLVRLVE